MKQENKLTAFIKSVLPHLGTILIMYLLTAFYFSPAVFDHKGLSQGDITSSFGWGQDISQYAKETGQHVFWSNRMFGGMPHNYTKAAPYKNINKNFDKILHLGLPRAIAGPFFFYMLGFYILLAVLGCSPLLSLIGAIAYAFASYNIIIIQAGHISKADVIGTIAPIIGGVILCYRKKYIAGSFITLLFTGLNIYWSHQQISYYLGIILVILAIVYFIYAIKEHTLKDYFKSSVLLILIAFLAISPSVGKLITTADYSKDTMRGGSVLTEQTTDQENKTSLSGETTNGNAATNVSGKKAHSGLDIDYAYAWSYGKAETMTLLIPDFYGGNSYYNIGNQSSCYKILKSTGQAKQFCHYAPTYWGKQPFTSGPVYAGAIVCFLFVLGLFVVKGREKWWILAATVLSFLLSWGKNFMGLNKILFYHLPLYNKFRTPSMALVIAGVTMALLGILAIKEIIEHKNDVGKKTFYLKKLYLSAGITGGLCLIFALFGKGLFDFSAPVDTSYPKWLVQALREDRAHLLVSDAWRSFWFIAFAFVLIWLFLKKKFKASYLIPLLGILILADMWQVDKRFLNNESFVPKKTAYKITPTSTDKVILQDKDPDFRVLNLTTNTFNESHSSYFYNCIGGYSPAKLRRYQDIIDYYLTGSLNMNVLNMLNTKYFIVPDKNQSNKPVIQTNPERLGNAWFVEKVTWVNNPNEEIASLKDFDPSKEAFIDKTWQKDVPESTSLNHPTSDSAYIHLSEYVHPGDLKYESWNKQAQMAVFSEVFYKTWKAFIDGKEAPVIRVNYILRGLSIPAGHHHIEFKCIDELYLKTAKISIYASVLISVVLALLLLRMIQLYFFKKK